MKLTDIVFKNRPLNTFVNYRHRGYLYNVIRIPALKDYVRVRKDHRGAAVCINELTQMMDCWKRTDFTPTTCGAETQHYLKCVAAAEVEQKEAAIRASKGLPAKGSNMRPSRQVNEMLARYPQPEGNFK